MKTFLSNNGLKIVAIIMLLGAVVASFSALFTLPVVYYQLMNWAVAGVAIMIVWQAYKNKKLYLAWLFALVAVIFNPVALVSLSALTWQIADIIVIVLLAVSFFLIKKKKS